MQYDTRFLRIPPRARVGNLDGTGAKMWDDAMCLRFISFRRHGLIVAMAGMSASRGKLSTSAHRIRERERNADGTWVIGDPHTLWTKRKKMTDALVQAEELSPCTGKIPQMDDTTKRRIREAFDHPKGFDIVGLVARIGVPADEIALRIRREKLASEAQIVERIQRYIASNPPPGC